MRELIGRTGLRRSRRQMLGLLGGAAVIGAAPHLALAQAAGGEPSEASVLRDPDIPVAGNPEGDIAIVEWFDYQCPYCRKLEPELQQIVQDDGKVRLLRKDWPILGPVSTVAARMALACKFQDNYAKAHDALIGVTPKLTDPRIAELLAAAGIEVDRANGDLARSPKVKAPSSATKVPNFSAERIPRLFRRNSDPVVVRALFQRMPVGGRDVPVHDGAIGLRGLAVGDARCLHRIIKINAGHQK